LNHGFSPGIKRRYRLAAGRRLLHSQQRTFADAAALRDLWFSWWEERILLAHAGAPAIEKRSWAMQSSPEK